MVLMVGSNLNFLGHIQTEGGQRKASFNRVLTWTVENIFVPILIRNVVQQDQICRAKVLMMQSSTHRHFDHGLFWSNSLLAPWTENLIVLRAHSGLSPNPSFGFVSPIRHLVHVLQITPQLITNAEKEGQS